MDDRARSVEEDWVERIAILMDRAIPIGQKYGIGIDSILGLIPGLGDVAGGLISAIIIVQAHRAGVPKATLMRMLANVGIDSALGAVPIVGDLFDIVFKANMRNADLYRQSIRGERRTNRDWGFLALLLLAIVLIVATPILLLVWVFQTASPF